MTYTLRNSQNEYQTVTDPIDDVSVHYGQGSNDWATCGQRAYELLDAQGNSVDWVTIVQSGELTTEEAAQYTLNNQYLIKVSTDNDDPGNIGEHSFTITSSLASYPVADDP